MAGDKRRKKPLRGRPGEGTVRTRPNGTIEARLPVGRDAQDRLILKTFYGRTEEEARAKHAAWMAKHPRGLPTADQQAPLNDLLMIYVETKIKPPAGADSTYRDTLRIIAHHIEATIGRTPLHELDLYKVNDWLRQLATTTGKGRLVERCHSIVRAALNYAVQAGTLASNPAQHATVPEYKRRKAQALTVAQAQALMLAASGRLDLRTPYLTADGKRKKWPKIDTRYQLLYLLAVTTGLRKGELLALRHSDLDPDAGVLTIARHVDTRGVEQDRVKTDASADVIYLDEHLVEAWQTHRQRLQGEAHQEGWKPDGLMFPTTEGTITTQRNLDRHWKSLLHAAGVSEPCKPCKGTGWQRTARTAERCAECDGRGVLTPTRFHDLRHSAGSLMLAEGGTLADVSRTLRHATAAITARIYLHGNAEGTRKAVGGVSRRMRGDE